MDNQEGLPPLIGPDFKLLDLRGRLPRRGRFEKQPLSRFVGTAVHHTVTRSSFYTGIVHAATRIADHHYEKGWDEVGYLMLAFEPTMEVALCGEVNSIRAHVLNQNHRYFGLAAVMDGRFETPSPEFVTLMQRCVDWLRLLVPPSDIPFEVLGHRDVEGQSTSCPTDALYDDNGRLLLR
jgi:hypothetical protein